jgi:hypothetical protein
MATKMQRQDLNPTLWGPVGWSFLDYVVMGFPDVAMMPLQIQLMNFLEGLGAALPCERCRNNFRKFAAAKPPGLAVWGKWGLTMWVSDLKQAIKEER